MAALSYRLGSATRADVRSATGKAVSEITIEGVVAGAITAGDAVISADTLCRQAGFAERGGNPQLGANLRRAIELVGFDDDALLRFYEMLRPGRSSGWSSSALPTRSPRGARSGATRSSGRPAPPARGAARSPENRQSPQGHFKGGCR